MLYEPKYYGSWSFALCRSGASVSSAVLVSKLADAVLLVSEMRDSGEHPQQALLRVVMAAQHGLLP